MRYNIICSPAHLYIANPNYISPATTASTLHFIPSTVPNPHPIPGHLRPLSAALPPLLTHRLHPPSAAPSHPPPPCASSSTSSLMVPATQPQAAKELPSGHPAPSGYGRRCPCGCGRWQPSTGLVRQAGTRSSKWWGWIFFLVVIPATSVVIFVNFLLYPFDLYINQSAWWNREPNQTDRTRNARFL